MRSERLATSSEALDAAEEEWWDRFSPVSERVWALDDGLSGALRSGYLDRAVEHFSRGERQGRILDLGCGSGLISRHFAAAGLPVLGVDVSGEQIQQARALAAGHPNEPLIEFRVCDAAEVWAAGETFDGVVSHAFLHHLASDELADSLARTRSILGPGGRAWFFEPVFFREGRLAPSALAAGGTRKLISSFSRLTRARRWSDEPMISRLEAFDAEAQEQGWFLSPKEVPFHPDELIAALAEQFEVERLRWENTVSYQLASALSLVSSGPISSGRSAVRAAARIDAALGAKGRLDRYRGLPGYGFASAFCRVPSA